MKLTSIAVFASALLGLSSLAHANTTAVTESVRLHVDVDRPVLIADSTERAVIKIGLDGIRLPRRNDRAPVNLAIVIDRSGSMSGVKITKAREAALEAVRRLAPDDIVSLIAYDSAVETLVPAQRVRDGHHLREAICRIEPRGNTALYDGVSRGVAELRRFLEDSRHVNRVILLSDGLANVGPSSPDELGRLGAAVAKEGISVTTVGLGLGFNEDLMTRLAQRSDGNTYFVEDSGDLPAIFAAELGDVLNVVGRRVVIEIDFPAGVRPLGFVGREGVIRGQKAELMLNQLYGGQEKFALLEVEVSPARDGTERELARARVSYVDAVHNRTMTLNATRTVQFSASRSNVIASADHKVQADYAANALAVAKDEAVALVDAQRRDEAGALLRGRAAELEKIGRVYSNVAVKALAAPAGAEADRLAREGLGNAERKTYRAESVQTRNQQMSTGNGSGR